MRLSLEGAKVLICSRNKNSITETEQEIVQKTGNFVKSYACDVTNEDHVNSMIEEIVREFGKIDILVTNAGGPPAGSFGDFKIDDYRKAFELNLLSTINLCQKVVPFMKKQSWGRIVMITSISVKQPIDNLILSNTARTGVIGFMKTLSNAVAADNITVNSICPGYTKTDRVENLAKSFAEKNGTTEGSFYEKLESNIPMKRIGTTNEFAQTVAFLVSESAGYITGVSLKIDGGFSKGLF